MCLVLALVCCAVFIFFLVLLARAVQQDPLAPLRDVRFSIIGGAGTAWLTLPNGERLNGRDKVKDYLFEHPEVVEEIRTSVLATLSGTMLDDDETPDAEAGDSTDPMEAMLTSTADRVGSA